MLTSNKVSAIFLSCLFKDGEDTKNYIKVEGIVTNHIGFHPVRLNDNKDKIIALLDELPIKFKEGWSFLNACEDKNGNQWTGEHRIMEQLFLLGIGINKVECLMPRDMWKLLPGGMPYYKVL